MARPASHVIGAAVAASVVATIARRRRTLTGGGAASATVAGTAVVAGGGGWWGALLVAFFTSSSALSRLARRRSPVSNVAARGDERDAVQVLANGGVATLLAIAAAFATPTTRVVLYSAYAGAVASATADTWATEIGALSATPPRSIVSGRPVLPGTSGGVTRLGTLASAVAATLIGLLAAARPDRGADHARPAILRGTMLAGLAGSIADSLFGATLQAVYHCPVCDQLTERQRHPCGTSTILVRGYRVITNDTVNAAATLIGAAVGAAIAQHAVAIDAQE
jgi:uncharacterized protein (TIGR00297 family)